MNDHFVLFVDDKTIFNSRWLDPDDPSYINSQSKIIRNPNPPEYFIDNLPNNFTVDGFSEMGFDKITSWLEKVFKNDIILPINMSELLYKAKDKTKDQSYFLFATLQDQLDYVRFPLGNFLKSEIGA